MIKQAMKREKEKKSLQVKTKKVTGLMKNNMVGKIITKFAEVRPKTQQLKVIPDSKR